MNNFLEIPQDRIIYKSAHFFIIKDKYPVSPGHMLIISKRWCQTYFDLNRHEVEELPSVLRMAKILIEMHHSPDGYNIGMNCGDAAGQSVDHFHCHVIPRYVGDMPNPKGGVRYCIPGKGYPDFFTSLNCQDFRCSCGNIIEYDFTINAGRCTKCNRIFDQHTESFNL